MSNQVTRVVLAPGTSTTLDPSDDPIEVVAGKCPLDAASDSPVLPRMPQSLAALRIADDVVGGLSIDDAAPGLRDALEQPATTAETMPEVDVEVVGVLAFEDVADAIRQHIRGDQVRIVVAADAIDLNAYRPVLDAAHDVGEAVEFVVPPPTSG